MTIKIRKIKKEESESLARIGTNAFPGGGNTVEGVLKWIDGNIDSQNLDDVFYGAFKDDKLVGGTRYLNFQMNLLSQKINVGGLGFVCVDLLHKKEKVAKEMMASFLEHYRTQKVNLTMLYPFRIPFYKKMGFGCGTEMYKFQVTPVSFPKGDSKEHLSYATEEDQDLLLDCYNRITKKTNGMMFKKTFPLSKDLNVIVYKENDQIKGYMSFTFEEVKENYQYLLNLRLYQLMFEDVKVLREFSTLLNSQSDQVQRIIHITQDDSLKYFLIDPANGYWDNFNSLYIETYITGQGSMYRVTDVAGIFKELSSHNFAGQDCRLKVTIRDTLLPENNGSTIIVFEKGFIKSIDSVGEYDVEMALDISDFSSLLVGGIHLKGLLKYGLVSVSDDSYIDTLEQIFQNERPICVTYF